MQCASCGKIIQPGQSRERVMGKTPSTVGKWVWIHRAPCREAAKEE